MQLNSKILRRICPIRFISCLRQTDRLSVESHCRRHSNDASTWMDTLCLCVIIYYNIGKFRGEAVVAPVFFAAHRHKFHALDSRALRFFWSPGIRNIAERLWGQIFFLLLSFLIFPAWGPKKMLSAGGEFAFELIPHRELWDYSFLESTRIRLKMKLR